MSRPIPVFGPGSKPSGADRGKWSEGKFKDYCDARSVAEADFDYYRYPDNRSGISTAVPADFECFKAGQGYLVEIKEVEHDFRLPYKNFDEGKVSRGRKRALAKSIVYVLVNHKTLGKEGRGWEQYACWRLVPIEFFLDRSVGGSWVLSEFPLGTFHDKMAELFNENERLVSYVGHYQ